MTRVTGVRSGRRATAARSRATLWFVDPAPTGPPSAFLDHARAPRFVGDLSDATHRADLDDAVCGDRLVLALHVAGGRVVQVRQTVVGCVGAVAAASALATLLSGREARPDAVTMAELDAALGGVPGGKRHALRLAAEALAAALRTSPTGPISAG